MRWLIERLTDEYPDLFLIEANRLFCRHTGDEISLSDDFALLPDSKLNVDYDSAFDALANQVAEDICLMQRDCSRNWLAAAHVCSPGHWSAEDKIGKPFTTIHDPVPGIGPINRNANSFINLMIHQTPSVRFAWGISTDDRLNHHPNPPAGIAAADWNGRCFDPENPSLFLRVERQVMWGLPAVDTSVFVIRVSYIPGEQIRSNPAERCQLIASLQNMKSDSRRYKGVEHSVDAILAWLDSECG